MDEGADNSSSYSSSSISYNLGFHHVFLSFRGPDTRKIFAGHLNAALQRKAIFTFIDSEKLEKGTAISVLLEAIEMSKLSIVIFSKDYAFSTWCLIELAKIMECMDSSKKQIVVPVFYEVDPAEIRYQTERFKEAFDKHERDGRESPEVLQRWRSALTKAATLSGWDSRIFQDDTKLIELIAEDIFEKTKVISSSISGWKHDVFVSFREEDTRKIFVGHLYAALKRKSINTFVDSEGLEKGDTIASEMLTAVKESKISIVVFSKNYADSSWCLDELTRIMECRNTKKHDVLPIFYEVYPSDVRIRSLRGSFGQGLDKHKQRCSKEKLNGWKAALGEAASLSGWDSHAHADDFKLIEEIAEFIYKRLIKSRSSRSILLN